MTRTPSRKELYHARASVQVTATAFELQSIDMVCVDFQNEVRFFFFFFFVLLFFSDVKFRLSSNLKTKL